MSRAARPSLFLPVVLAALLVAFLALRGTWVDAVAIAAIVVALAVWATTTAPSRYPG